MKAHKEPVQICFCSIKSFALAIGFFDVYQCLREFIVMLYIVVMYVGLPQTAYANLPENESAEFPAIQFFLIYFPRMFVFLTMMIYEMPPWIRMVYFFTRFITCIAAFFVNIPMWVSFSSTLSTQMELWPTTPTDKDLDYQFTMIATMIY